MNAAGSYERTPGHLRGGGRVWVRGILGTVPGERRVVAHKVPPVGEARDRYDSWRPERRSEMIREEATELILEAKKEKELTFEAIA